MRRLRGSPASPGVASGPWTRIRPTAPPIGGRIDPSQADAEVARLQVAASAAAATLEGLAADVARAGHKDEGAIFSAQAAMARDPALATSAEARIREGEDAVAAVTAAAATLAEQLRGLGDELLSARAADVEDVAGRIAGLLAGRTDAGPGLEEPSVVVAEDLPPSVTASLPRDRLLGLALEAGSPTAHAAILARAYGIPAVVGVAGLLEAVDAAEASSGAGPAPTPTTMAADGHPRIVIDGERGEVVLDPDAPTLDRLGRRRADAEAEARADLAEAALPARTPDGADVMLLANIGTPDEADRCVRLGARGVGLFRTEFLFIERSVPPSEDEQIAAYRAVLEAFAPGPVTIRLLDIGGDKPIPYLRIPPEANPFLGVRALRLAPERPDLFVTQLRAAMRAAAAEAGRPIGPVKVMAPMVADGTDVDVLLGLVERAAGELDREGLPRGAIVPGVMLEIPAAILVGDSYLGRLGFASLGTNDLLQYTLAVDRGNRGLGRYQDSLHPALLRLVREAVERAERAGIELSVCGEMAGDPVAALALVGLGIRQLSMASTSLGRVRRAIRRVPLETLEGEARACLALDAAASVRERLRPLLEAG